MHSAQIMPHFSKCNDNYKFNVLSLKPNIICFRTLKKKKKIKNYNLKASTWNDKWKDVNIP